jgi:hypothetical protein
MHERYSRNREKESLFPGVLFFEVFLIRAAMALSIRPACLPIPLAVQIPFSLAVAASMAFLKSSGFRTIGNIFCTDGESRLNCVTVFVNGGAAKFPVP